MTHVRKAAIAAAIVALSAWSLGCRNRKPADPTAGPRQAIADLKKAWETEDKALFLRTIAADPADIPYIERMFEFSTALEGVARDMEKVYGTERDTTGPTGVNIPDPAALQIQVEGDKAVANAPGSRKMLHLVLKEGTWRLDVSDLSEKKGESRAQFICGSQKVIEGVRALREKIRKGEIKEDEANLFLTAVIFAGVQGTSRPGTSPTP